MNDIIVTQTDQQIGYKGKVTLNLYDSDRKKTINTVQVHNTGTVHMFNFLANCLIAQWNVAQANYPSRIVIFKTEAGEETFDPDKWKSENAITPDTGILQSSIPLLETDYDKQTCSVKFHFRIPTSLISQVGSAGKIGLYSRMITLNEPLAYVFISSEEQSALAAAANNPHLVIILDWVLTIPNKAEGE